MPWIDNGGNSPEWVNDGELSEEQRRGLGMPSSGGGTSPLNLNAAQPSPYMNDPTGTGPIQQDPSSDGYGQAITTHYNPTLFASDPTAQQEAQQYGGSVISGPSMEAGGGTPGSPFTMPNANYIKLANGGIVNAGQIQQWQQLGRQDLIDNEFKNAFGSPGNGAEGTGAQDWFQQYDPSGMTGVAGTPTWSPPSAPPSPSPSTTPRATSSGTQQIATPGRTLPRGTSVGTDDATAPPTLHSNPSGAGVGAPRNAGIGINAPRQPATGGSNVTPPMSGAPSSTPPSVGVPRTGGNGTPPSINPPRTPVAPPTGATPPTAPKQPSYPGTPAYTPPGTSVPAGTNPTFPTWSAGDGTGNQAYSGGDPGYMSSALANRAQDYGSLFENNYGGAYDQAQLASRTYQDQADQGYNWLNENPGYSTADANNITRDGELKDAMTTDGEYNSNYLSDGERQGMMGDTGSVGRAFNPNDITSTASRGNQWTKDQYQNSYQAAKDALNTGETAARGDLGTYGSRLRGAYGSMASGVRGSLDSSDNAINSNLQQTKDEFGQIIDPTRLGISDQTVAGMKDQAGRQIGLNYAAAQDDLTRRAEADGNVNPLSINAARQRLLRSQSIDNADAVTNADLAAREAQRKANMDIAGLKLNAATTTGQMGQAGAEFSGAQRVGAEQQLGTAGMGAESEIGNAGLNTDMSLTGLRTGTESAYGSLGANVGATTNAQDIAATEAAGTTAIGQAQYKDTQDAARATTVAQNRQTTGQNNQQQRYSQGYNTNTALSGRYKSVADQAIQGQQAARNYWQGQSQYQGSQANAASSSRVAGAQTSLNGMSQGTNSAMGTEIGRRSTRPVTIGPGGISVGI